VCDKWDHVDGCRPGGWLAKVRNDDFGEHYGCGNQCSRLSRHGLVRERLSQDQGKKPECLTAEEQSSHKDHVSTSNQEIPTQQSS
jgi:hypothetical protein